MTARRSTIAGMRKRNRARVSKLACRCRKNDTLSLLATTERLQLYILGPSLRTLLDRLAHHLPWLCREMALPRSWLKGFSPMALRTTTTRGAKGPPVALLPII